MSIEFASGMRLTPARLNALIPSTRWKAGDTSRVTSTVLTADPELAVPVVAGQVYAVTVRVAAAYDAAADLKVGWSYPFGSTMPNWQASWRTTDGVELSGVFAAISATVPITSTGGTTSQPYWAFGIFTAAADGTLAFAWSQNTSAAGATTIRAGSAMTVRRLQ